MRFVGMNPNLLGLVKNGFAYRFVFAEKFEI